MGQYGVICWPCGGGVPLTDEQYDQQMDLPDSRWRCPRCGRSCEFDNEQYEEHLEQERLAAEATGTGE